MERGSDKIIAVKRGAPIVCGKSESGDNLFVASDPYALLGHTGEVFFPEDEVLCLLDPKSDEKIQFTELDGRPSQRFFSQKQDKKSQGQAIEVNSTPLCSKRSTSNRI